MGFKDILIERERLASLGELMGGITHNLKTPLMGSIGQLMLSDKKLNKLLLITEENNKDFKILINDIKNNNNNIRNYLVYMSEVIKTITNQVNPNKTSCSQNFTIKELFEKSMLLTSFEVKKNHINLITSISEQIITLKINGDSSILLQILLNMIENSITAYIGKNGDILLNAEIIIDDDEQKFIKILVIDQGCGIPKTVHTKIFNKMITTKGSGGTGIGLYLSNIMIKAKFNGYLECTSKENNGTTMSIIFPLI